MNKYLYNLIILSLFVVVFTCNLKGQGLNFLKNQCPNSQLFSSFTLENSGDINAIPCSGKDFLVNGVPISGGGIAIGDTITGATQGSVLFVGVGGILTQDNTGFFFDNSTNTLRLTSAIATDIPLSLNGAVAQSGNYLNVTSNGGGAGNVFNIASNGQVNVTGRIIVTGSGNYIAWGDTFFGDVLGTGVAVAGYNTASGFRFRDNSGNLTGGIDGATRTSWTYKGANVASAAAIVPTGNIFHVTGTTNITSITATGITAGTCLTLIFDDVLTFTDGSNLVLAGNFVTTANDTINVCYDGTSFFETARSIN